MPEENRVIDKIVGADGNAQRFHQGKHPQGGIPAELLRGGGAVAHAAHGLDPRSGGPSAVRV